MIRRAAGRSGRRNDFQVYALYGEGVLEKLGLDETPGAARPFAGGVCFTDPRLAAAGARAILPKGGTRALEAAGLIPASVPDYEAHRLSLGLAEGGIDIIPEKNFLLECNFEELHGVDFNKGCYVGQEVTARSKHRSTVRKRLLPARIEGPLPPFGTAIMAGEKEVGVLRSAMGDRAIALIRLERLQEAEAAGIALCAGEAVIIPEKPDWLDL